MRKTLQKLGALLCAAVFVLSVLVVPAGAEPLHEVKPSVNGWKESYNYNGTSTWKIDGDTIVISNPSGNHIELEQTIEVKPGREYIVSANVRVTNYEPTEKNESGVSLINVAVGEGGVRSWYANSPSWTWIATGFDSQINETSRTISISFGDFDAMCKGTAYIKDVVVVETGSYYTGEIEFTGIQASTANGSISGQVIGGGGLWAAGVNGLADAWDGNGNTFYDPEIPGLSCWTGILADSATHLKEVRILPRISFFDRTDGARIEGSNDGIHWTTLVTFSANDCLRETAAQTWIKKTVNHDDSYWMFRYVNDGTSHGDVADVVLIGEAGTATLALTPGMTIGKVLATDIRAYINGAEIPAYNIGGKLAILVSDLNNYGFKTSFDNSLRKTTVTRDRSQTKFTSVPSKATGLKVGTPVMSVFSTDIVVELNGRQVNAFNVDNRMAIYLTELKACGDVVYDNAARASRVTLK